MGTPGCCILSLLTLELHSNFPSFFLSCFPPQSISVEYKEFSFVLTILWRFEKHTREGVIAQHC